MSHPESNVGSELAARIRAVPPSATLAITSEVRRLKAQGVDVIGFGAGEPDFPTPAHVVEAAVQAARDPKNHRYSPAAGLPELRAAVAAKTRRDSGYEVSADQVVIANGGKQAVYDTMQVLVDPGDEVLIPAPYWVTYPEAVKLAEGVPVVVPPSRGVKVTPEDLDAAVTDRTKLVVFVSPSNPTGAVYDRDEVRAIGEWAASRGIWVMCDEIYEHLVYGAAEFVSMPVEVPEVVPRCVVVNGVAKTYAMTGWRVGWLIAPEPVAAAAIRLQSHLSSNVANVCQRAAFAAVEGPMDPVYAMREAFDRRRRIMHARLDAMPGVTCEEPLGAFYAFPDISEALARGVRGAMTATDFAAALLAEAHVAVVPGDAFGAPGFLRLSFALGDDDLVEGLDRLERFLSGG